MKSTPSARQIAVSLLAGRDYSRQQIKQKLEAKEFAAEEIEAVLDACEQSGYIDDKRFAQMLLRSHIYKGHGPIRIKQAMMLKGVSSEIVAEAINGSDCDWFELAKEKVEKKYTNKAIADYKEKAKRIRFLMGQGFDYEQANYALSQSNTE
ncbi:regulatory protein RecX [Shewanella sp. 202IG2-18]|uniref:regulatory protein RecX n=1 Tax=Parashewanella hymeniacidonis TaxID=2807618 RepID=UPI00195FACFB|nr:regulatory protein RecX [Parashewanella hymeniacidonis]MBM7072931.1 regulatory protein RecX [Parashewanella hymeniacidonis]